MRAWLAVLAVVVLVVGSLGSAVASPSSSPLGAIPTPTGPHPASIYRVTNLDVAAVTVKHTFTTTAGALTYEFSETLTQGQSKDYHVFAMDQIPMGFSGSVDLSVEQYTNDPPIAAEVIGYDYIIHHQQLPIIRK